MCLERGRLDIEELVSRGGAAQVPNDHDDAGEDDDVEGWVDEREELSLEDREALETSTRPVTLVLVLVKVSSVYHPVSRNKLTQAIL